MPPTKKSKVAPSAKPPKASKKPSSDSTPPNPFGGGGFGASRAFGANKALAEKASIVPFVMLPFVEKVTVAAMYMFQHSPFFGVLVKYAKVLLDAPGVPTAATNGVSVMFNTDFMNKLSLRQFIAVYMHETMHMAFAHVTRRGTRDGHVWNLAGDTVINGMIAKQTFCELPADCFRRQDLEDKSADEVYEILLKEQQEEQKKPPSGGGGGGGKPPSSGKGKSGGTPGPDGGGGGPPGSGGGGGGTPGKGKQPGVGGHGHKKGGCYREPPPGTTDKQIEGEWRRAVNEAASVARQHGNMPAGLDRILGEALDPHINWRDVLSQFLSRAPADFGEFDRRFMSRGLYIEELNVEEVRVWICIDTSGSVDGPLLNMFLTEVYGVLSAYPHMKARLFYCDTELHGPYDLNPSKPMPVPVGGGGTSFEPFFEFLAEDDDVRSTDVALYFTDGFGSFPSATTLETMWAVTPGGLDDAQFPFGRVLRLVGTH